VPIISNQITFEISTYSKQVFESSKLDSTFL